MYNRNSYCRYCCWFDEVNFENQPECIECKITFDDGIYYPSNFNPIITLKDVKGITRIETDSITCENCLFLDNVCFMNYMSSGNETCVYGKECVDELLQLRWLFD